VVCCEYHAIRINRRKTTKIENLEVPSLFGGTKIRRRLAEKIVNRKSSIENEIVPPHHRLNLKSSSHLLIRRRLADSY